MIYKFATMVKNSSNIGAGDVTLRNDPRVTKVGKYPLTKKERQILIDAGFKLKDIEIINQEIKSLKFNE